MANVSGGALEETVSSFEATQDALFGGSVVLFQPARGVGYRTNVDALLLAAFAAAPGGARAGSTGAFLAQFVDAAPAQTAYDLGAGVGAVGLALLRLGAAKRVVLVEIDAAPAAMARRNLDANGWTDRGEVLRADVRDVARSRRGQATLVVCNPPYVAPGRGRVAPAQERARCGELRTFVGAARQIAGRKARVCFVYPAQELGLLLASLEIEGLHAKRLRFVHASQEAPARVALVEARAARPGGLAVMPPLVERETTRDYTPEMQALLAQH